MDKGFIKVGLTLIALIFLGACNGLFGPDKTGEIQLSSETFGDTYYLFGYSYEDAEFYRFQYQGDPLPDIFNEGYRALVGGTVKTLPGFNTPGQSNGFALLGEFSTLKSARDFYKEYSKIEAGLQFETVSDTVKLFQVWAQQTGIGNYVKLLVKDVQNFEGETGAHFNEVSLEYTYQPNGSTSFTE